MRALRLVTRLLVVVGWLLTLAGLVVVQALGDRSALGTLAMYAPRHLTPWPWLLPLLLALFVSWRLAVASALGFVVTLLGVASFNVPWTRLTASNAEPPAAELPVAELPAQPAAEPSVAEPPAQPPAEPAVAELPAQPAAEPPPAPSLRIVTYNTDGSVALADRIAQDARAWNADLAVLIDCRPGVAHALRALDGYRLVQTEFYCLLTRHELVRARRMPAAITAVVRAAGSGRAGRVHRLDLRVHDRPLTLYPLHLETPRSALWAARQLDLSRLERNAAIRAFDSEVASRFVDRTAPGLIVLGDFNLDVNSAIYRRDWGDLTNAWSAAGLGFGHTMFAGRHRVRIDHVLVGAGWTVEEVEVQRGFPSEHQPVVVTVRGKGWR